LCAQCNVENASIWSLRLIPLCDLPIGRRTKCALRYNTLIVSWMSLQPYVPQSLTYDYCHPRSSCGPCSNSCIHSLPVEFDVIVCEASVPGDYPLKTGRECHLAYKTNNARHPAISRRKPKMARTRPERGEGVRLEVLYGGFLFLLCQ
jgi:hypothetical protein